MKKWQTLSSKIVLDNPWMKVRQEEVRLPSGKILKDYYLWEKGNNVLIVPVTKRGKIVFTRQYRQGVKDFMIELPAGFIEDGETVEQAAIRELKEETDCIGEIEKLGTFSTDSDKVSARMAVCVAHGIGLKEKSGGLIRNPADNEEIELLTFSRQETVRKIRQGEIWATEVIAALFLFFDWLDRQIGAGVSE